MTPPKIPGDIVVLNFPDGEAGHFRIYANEYQGKRYMETV